MRDGGGRLSSSPVGWLDRVTGYLTSRYGLLLSMLLALLFTYPFTADRRGARFLLDSAWLFVTVSLVRAMWPRRALRRVLLALGVPTIVVGALAGSAGLDSLHPLSLALRVALLAVILVGLFGSLLERERITMDAVLGACCIYLLLGVGWSNVYGLLQWADPTTFALSAREAPGVELELLYFSLITMTTVGYGDITPATGLARMVAAIEALVAQLYLAIIIARFVGMELVHRDRRPPA